jgi:hypothetical protein
MPIYDLVQVITIPASPFEVKLERTSDDTYNIQRWCSICKRPSLVMSCRKESVEAWSLGTGEYVQNAFPEKSADERETIMSGAHGKCFDAEFPDEDEEPWFEDPV